MKRKLFATLVCLLMMATFLPTVGMATDTAILVNGGFEDDLAEWTQITGGENTTTFSVVESDSIGEGEGAVTILPHSGSKMLKITGAGRKFFHQELKNLKPNRRYMFEGYVNIPVSGAGPKIMITDSLNLEAHVNYKSVLGWYTKGMTETTDGWQKFTRMLTYEDLVKAGVDTKSFTISNTIDGNVYFDDISVRELDEDVLFRHEFETFTNDQGTFTDAGALIALTPATNTDSSPVASVYATADGNAIKIKSNGANGQDALKISLCNMSSGALLPGYKYPDGFSLPNGTPLLLRFKTKPLNIVTEGTTEYQAGVRTYYNGGTAGAWVTCKVGVDTTEWTQHEMWFPMNSLMQLYILRGTADVDWLIDDIEICLAKDIYVENNATIHTTLGDTFTDAKTTDVFLRSSVKKDIYTSSDIFAPFIRLSTKEAAKRALAVTAVYKNAGGYRQLLWVATKNMEATSSMDSYYNPYETTLNANFKAGIHYVMGDVDLSTLNIVEEEGVTYFAETYLWDVAKMQAVTGKIVKPITVVTEK